MQFIRIGKYVVNLANVTEFYQTERDGRPCIRIDFVGGSWESLYSHEEGYEALKTALDAILGNTGRIGNALQSKGERHG